MGFDNICNTGLVLGLGFPSAAIEITTSSNSNPANPAAVHKKSSAITNFEPSLTLGLSGETIYEKVDSVSGGGTAGTGGGGNNNNNNNNNSNNLQLHREDSGAASSFSNVSVKRERDIVPVTAAGSEEAETTTREREMVNFGSSSRATTIISDEDDDGVNGRKKLRLTKAQSALLEESFKVHSTLNPKQKQELARDLKLRPRQVEVWFQNRRARTKLKQTEVDCEYLKKCCETLTDENRRLQKELQELKALKLAQPFYMQLPAATLTMCPSCEKVGGDVNTAATTTTKSSFSSALAPKPQFFNPFTSPSAAC